MLSLSERILGLLLGATMLIGDSYWLMICGRPFSSLN